MGDRDFHRVRGQVLDLHRKGRYREALLVAEEASQNFSEKEAETSYWIACLKCRLGNPEGALSTLQEALKEGHWWAKCWLTQDPDLESVRVALCSRKSWWRADGATRRLKLGPNRSYWFCHLQAMSGERSFHC